MERDPISLCDRVGFVSEYVRGLGSPARKVNRTGSGTVGALTQISGPAVRLLSNAIKSP